MIGETNTELCRLLATPVVLWFDKSKNGHVDAWLLGILPR